MAVQLKWRVLLLACLTWIRLTSCAYKPYTQFTPYVAYYDPYAAYWQYHSDPRDNQHGYDRALQWRIARLQKKLDYVMKFLPPPQGSLRLVDSTNPNEGRVEIFMNGEWGTICDDSFYIESAIVICRALGLPSDNVTLFAGTKFRGGHGRVVALDEVECHGNETSLLDCPAYPFQVGNCYHNEDVGVGCYPLISA